MRRPFIESFSFFRLVFVSVIRADKFCRQMIDDRLGIVPRSAPRHTDLKWSEVDRESRASNTVTATMTPDEIAAADGEVQIKAPRGTFPGEVAEGYYCVVDNAVVLTDADGRPINSEKRHLGPGDDARFSCRLVRNRRRPSSGFNRPLNYPKWVF